MSCVDTAQFKDCGFSMHGYNRNGQDGVSGFKCCVVLKPPYLVI